MLASEPFNTLQFDDPVRLSGSVQHGRRNVVNGDAHRSFSVGNAIVRVAMEYCRGAESVDRFFQATGTEEGKDFRVFSLQGRANWRIMQHHDPALSLQLHQGLLEANGVAD